MLFGNPFKSRMPLKAEALPGRDFAIWDGAPHAVLGTSTMAPFPEHLQEIHLGLDASGGLSVYSGNSMASIARRLVTRVVSHQIRLMKKCVPVARDIQRLSLRFSIQTSFHLQRY